MAGEASPNSAGSAPSGNVMSDALEIYLQDHMAGSTAGVSLAERIRDSNEGSELGELMERITREVAEDRDELKQLMDDLGASESPVKNASAWLGEHLGRLKPNGALSGYTDLGRLIELEGLHLGVSGKRSLWENLQETLGEHPLAAGLPRLIERADAQLEDLHRERQAAVRIAFGLDGD